MINRDHRNHPIEANDLHGTYTALITPMLEGDGLTNEIDYDKMFRLIGDQVSAGVRGIVVAGTTGQSSTLSLDEHATIVEEVFHYTSHNHPDLQFIVGAGSNCTRDAINLSSTIEGMIGPSTFLHVTGYYNNPPQEGIVEHFERLAACLPKSNIILYNVPKRTGSNIKAETVAHLAEVDNIIGIKIATGIESIEDACRIAYENNHKRFVVLSGEDLFTARIIQNGGRGVISATANIAPAYFVRMVNEALEGNHEEADRMRLRINPFIKHVVFADKNPIPLSCLFDTEVRLPLIKTEDLENILQYSFLDPNFHDKDYSFSPEELGIDLRNYRREI